MWNGRALKRRVFHASIQMNWKVLMVTETIVFGDHREIFFVFRMPCRSIVSHAYVDRVYRCRLELRAWPAHECSGGLGLGHCDRSRYWRFGNKLSIYYVYSMSLDAFMRAGDMKMAGRLTTKIVVLSLVHQAYSMIDTFTCVTCDTM